MYMCIYLYINDITVCIILCMVIYVCMYMYMYIYVYMYVYVYPSIYIYILCTLSKTNFSQNKKKTVTLLRLCSGASLTFE